MRRLAASTARALSTGVVVAVNRSAPTCVIWVAATVPSRAHRSAACCDAAAAEVTRASRLASRARSARMQDSVDARRAVRVPSEWSATMRCQAEAAAATARADTAASANRWATPPGASTVSCKVGPASPSFRAPWLWWPQLSQAGTSHRSQ